MPLIPCPTCGRQVSPQAPQCPGCGHPVAATFAAAAPAPRFRGPPIECAHCGGQLTKGKDAKNEGSGCLLAVVGLLLTPFIIGIPILIWGLHMAGKREGFWQCQRCGAKAPRQIGTFEYG